MSHIQKVHLKNGTAHIVYWSVKGLPNKRYFGIHVPYADVKQWASRTEADKWTSPVAPARTTLTQMLDAYVTQRQVDIPVWRHKTAMRWLIRYAGDLSIDRITAETIHQFRDWLLGERLKRAKETAKARRGVNHELRHIAVIFKWCYRQDIIAAPIFDKVQFLKTTKPVPDVLTPDEVNRIRLALKKRNRLIFHFLRFTGLRIGEACKVRIKDIDLVNDEIKLYNTKNGIEESIMLHRNLKRLATKTDWLSRDKNDKVIKISSQRVCYIFRNAMNKAGVYKKMPCHILRHSAGRRILEAYYTTGNAKAIAKKFLRHKTDKMTDYYQQTYLQDIKSAMEKVKL